MYCAVWILLCLVSCTWLECTAQKVKVDKKVEIKKALSKLEAMLMQLKKSKGEKIQTQQQEITIERCAVFFKQSDFNNIKVVENISIFEGNEDFLTNCSATSCLQKPFRLRLPMEINTNSDNMFYACPRDFLFFVNQSKTCNEAMLDCCNRGMKLIHVENGKKLNCLMRRHVENFGSTVNREYWTSSEQINSNNFECKRSNISLNKATSVTSNKNIVAFDQQQQKNINLCTTAEIIPRKLDINLRHANPNSGWISDRSRNLNYAYVCEAIDQPTTTTENPACIQPQCPSISLCNTRSTMDHIEEAVKEPQNYFETAKFGCGFKFMLSKILVTFPEAYQICCRLGMQVATLRTSSKASCVEKLYSELVPLDTYIWSSASSNGCARQWAWCTPNKTESFDRQSGVWNGGEPNNHQNDERCATHFTKHQFRMNDIHCFEKFAFVCEKPFDEKVYLEGSANNSSRANSTTGI